MLYRKFHATFFSGVLLPLLAWQLSACGGGGGESAVTETDSTVDAQAQQLFVSPDGSDHNDGSLEAPYQTVSWAAAHAIPGSTITLLGGRYDELVRIEKSGASGAPITVTPAPGAHAVINGMGIAGEHAVVVSGNWIVLQQLEIENGGDKGLLVLANNVVVDNVSSHHNAGTGIQIFSGSGNIARNCLAFNNVETSGGGEDADGVSISGNGNRVVNCVAYGNSDDGFDAWNSTNAVFESCTAYDNGRGPAGDGNGFKLSNLPGGATTAVRNIAFANLRRGFTSNGGSGHLVLHNTAWNNPVNFQSTGPAENELVNNLSYAGRIDLSAATREQSNSWNLGIDQLEFRSLDPSSPEFLRPGTSSAAIDAGVDVGEPYGGTAPDLGAFELH